MFRTGFVSVLIVLLAGCGESVTACPAILHGSTLTVRLADDWPAGGPRSVTVRCPDDVECGPTFPSDVTLLPEPEAPIVPSPGTLPPPTTPEPAPETGGTTQELENGVATYSLVGPGESVIVTVSEAGSVLTELTVHPDWVRVGGSEECGGPREAEVVVPAP